MQKVFRVRLSEQFSFYVDVRADNETAAMENVTQRLSDKNDDITPIEDDRFHIGYVVDSAEEIEEDKADLE